MLERRHWIHDDDDDDCDLAFKIVGWMYKGPSHLNKAFHESHESLGIEKKHRNPPSAPCEVRGHDR